MASITQNINQAISDFGSIKTAIQNKGVSVPSGTPTSQYASKINSIQTGITPSGTISITSNGTTDVTQYASANVNVSGGSDAVMAALINRTITSLVIPEGVTYVGEYIGYSCANLTSVTFPSTTEEIGSTAFCGAGLVGTLTIPDNVWVISDTAFAGCRGITSVVLGTALTNIDADAFQNCSGITDVYYKGTQAQWNEIDIDDSNTSLLNANIHYNYTPAS